MGAKVAKKPAPDCPWCTLAQGKKRDHDWCRYVWFDMQQVIVEDRHFDKDGVRLLYVPRPHAHEQARKRQLIAHSMLMATGASVALERDLRLGEVTVPGGGRHWYAEMILEPVQRESEND